MSGQLKGNGKKGTPIRYQSIASGGGCLKHNCSDCRDCPVAECDYCYFTEQKLKKDLQLKVSVI